MKRPEKPPAERAKRSDRARERAGASGPPPELGLDQGDDAARRTSTGRPSSDPMLDAIDAIGGAEDARELADVVPDLERALDALEAAHAPESRERRAADHWGHVQRLKAALRANGIGELPALRNELGALRRLLGISTPPRLPEASLRVLARMGAGPLVHLPTGLPTLDNITRGGLLAARLVVIGGEPDTGKTSLAVQLGHHLARARYAVAFHCVDEEREGIECRIGQACALALEQLEARDEAALAFLSEHLREIPNLMIIDQEEDERTIDDTADMLEALATRHGSPGKVLIVDSLQTARARALDQLERSGRTVTAKDRADVITKTVKAIARRTGALVIITSELARGAYRARRTKDRTAPMASFKESGSIEYGMWTGLVLTRIPNEPNAVRVDVPKNKRGLRGVAFKLMRDPARCTYTDAGIIREAEQNEDAGDRHGDEQSAASKARDEKDIDRARHVLRSHPEGVNREEWIAEIGGKMSRARIAIRRLEKRGEVAERKNGRRVFLVYRAPSSSSPTTPANDQR